MKSVKGIESESNTRVYLWILYEAYTAFVYLKLSR